MVVRVRLRVWPCQRVASLIKLNGLTLRQPLTDCEASLGEEVLRRAIGHVSINSGIESFNRSFSRP